MDMETTLERRFGAVAVEKGFITAEQIIDAMKIQILEDLDKGEHRLIGRILLEGGLMTVAQVQEVIEAMGIPVPRR